MDDPAVAAHGLATRICDVMVIRLACREIVTAISFTGFLAQFCICQKYLETSNLNIVG